MTDAATVSFPEAAARLGVPLRILRRAISAGRLPAPPSLAATAAVPAAWVETAVAAARANAKALNRTSPQKVPPFARYEGTSAWRKYGNRVREFAKFQADVA